MKWLQYLDNGKYSNVITTVYTSVVRGYSVLYAKLIEYNVLHIIYLLTNNSNAFIFVYKRDTLQKYSLYR